MINLTLMRENVDELIDFVKLAEKYDKLLEINFLNEALKLDTINSKDGLGQVFIYKEQKLSNIKEKVNNNIKAALKLSEKLDVKVSLSGCSQLYEDEDGKKLSKEVKDCHYVDKIRMLFADGRTQYCVWMTSPIYNWRESKIMDPRLHPRGAKVRELINNNIIPHECSGAGCEFVNRKISNDKKDIEATKYSGGWSGNSKEKKY